MRSDKVKIGTHVMGKFKIILKLYDVQKCIKTRHSRAKKKKRY